MYHPGNDRLKSRPRVLIDFIIVMTNHYLIPKFENRIGSIESALNFWTGGRLSVSLNV